MNIKKYRAPDTAQAMKLVRDAHGPDAVILDCYPVQGGVEVAVSWEDSIGGAAPNTAGAEATGGVEKTAMDVLRNRGQGRVESTPSPDPGQANGSAASKGQGFAAQGTSQVWAQDNELHSLKQEMAAMKAMLVEQLRDHNWQQLGTQQPNQKDLHQFMTAMDIDPSLAKRLAEKVPTEEAAPLQRQILKMQLIKELPIAPAPESGAVALVGPQGAGKTTSIVKLAAQYAMRHGRDKVAILSTDVARIGAQEQLRTFGRILQLPIHLTRDAEEAAKTFRLLQSKPLLLVDTGGISFRDKAGIAELAELLSAMPGVQTYLTLPADIEAYVQSEIIDAFSHLSPQGALISRIDETMRLGSVISNLMLRRLPAVWCTNGPKVPQNLSPADAEKLVNMAVKMSRHFERGRSNKAPASQPTAQPSSSMISEVV